MHVIMYVDHRLNNNIPRQNNTFSPSEAPT